MNAIALSASQPWFDRERLSQINGFAVILAGSGVLFITGMLWSVPAVIGAGAAGLCMSFRAVEQQRVEQQRFDGPRQTQLRQLATRLLLGAGRYTPEGSIAESAGKTTRRLKPFEPHDENDDDEEPNYQMPTSIDSTGELVEAMLATDRYALLLRPETTAHLSRDQFHQATETLDEQMSLVPAGTVLTGVAAERATLGQEASAYLLKSGAEGVVRVEACYLDRWTVTNRQFQNFVDSGGYEQLEFWAEEALPAIFDFVDTTGQTAPRYWIDGNYPEGEGRLPVVGISWYEAVAYARWVGKRLPTDAEWTKACAWPIEAGGGRIAQRRYPWGEAFNADLANLWCTGRGGPAPVTDSPDGATVGGLEQMVGNVWEWTASTLDESTPSAAAFPSALRSVRGGAYNTYFENQATCHFQSGEHPLARRPNIGLRLALSLDAIVGA